MPSFDVRIPHRVIAELTWLSRSFFDPDNDCWYALDGGWWEIEQIPDADMIRVTGDLDDRNVQWLLELAHR
jgi:hypothetical protein